MLPMKNARPALDQSGKVILGKDTAHEGEDSNYWHGHDDAAMTVVASAAVLNERRNFPFRTNDASRHDCKGLLTFRRSGSANNDWQPGRAPFG